jgi:hypothetical protein
LNFEIGSPPTKVLSVAAHVGDLNAELGRFLAVDDSAQLGLAHRKRGIGVDDARQAAHARHDLIGIALQGGQARPAQVKFEIGLADAAAGKRIDSLDAHPQVRVGFEEAARVGHHVELRVIALRQVDESHVDVADGHVALARLDVAGGVADGACW